MGWFNGFEVCFSIFIFKVEFIIRFYGYKGFMKNGMWIIYCVDVLKCE